MNRILIKHTKIPGKKPDKLALGELAVNTADGVLFFRSPSGKLHEIKMVTQKLPALDRINLYFFLFLLTHWAVAVVFFIIWVVA